jgi:hypothetical protein
MPIPINPYMPPPLPHPQTPELGEAAAFGFTKKMVDQWQPAIGAIDVGSRPVNGRYGPLYIYITNNGGVEFLEEQTYRIIHIAFSNIALLPLANLIFLKEGTRQLKLHQANHCVCNYGQASCFGAHFHEHYTCSTSGGVSSRFGQLLTNWADMLRRAAQTEEKPVGITGIVDKSAPLTYSSPAHKLLPFSAEETRHGEGGFWSQSINFNELSFTARRSAASVRAEDEEDDDDE